MHEGDEAPKHSEDMYIKDLEFSQIKVGNDKKNNLG